MNKVATSIEPAESELLTAPSIESINELAQCFEQLSNRGSACIVANNPFKVKEAVSAKRVGSHFVLSRQ